MARPLATAVGRPPPSQRSFHGYRESAGPSVGDDVVPHIRYEGYNITPEDSEYHDKWHRAHIRPMPVTQREFENLIQKQSLSDNPVTKELCGPRMTNSKTECIASHIDARDALDPEREHELAYLKLERRHRSKSSKKTTVSMQIIFECKIRPPSNKVPALQAVATHGSRIINGNSSAASSVPTTNPNAGTILTVPVGASRPQYTPTYALQRGLSSTDNCQKVNADKGRDSRDPSILTLALARSDYDSDESDDLRAPSQCSIVSSDTVMSSSRRTSSSSVSNSNTPATSQIAKDGNLDGSPCTTGYAPRDRLDERWNTKQCTGDSSLQPQYRRHSDTEGVVLPQKYHYADQRHVLECLYIDTGTQTDPELNESCCGGSFLDRNEREKPNAKSVELADHGSSSKKDCVLGDQSEEGEKATSKHDAAKDIDPTVKEASVKDRSTESFEKPAWMNNLRPVYTPTIKNEDLDPFDNSIDELSAPGPKAKTLPRPSASEEKATGSKEEAKDSLENSIHPPRSDTDQIPSTASPSTSSNQKSERDAPTPNGNTLSDHYLDSASDPRPDERYRPPASLPLDIHNQPRRQSEDPSPKQRKRVTFSFPPSPASTVPSTPIHGTPPSSPDTASSTSTTEYVPTPTPSKPLTTTSRRPSLQRSSHSTSSYTTDARSHAPIPPRSSSYKDLPIKNPTITNPTNTPRHPPAENTKPYRQNDRYDQYHPITPTAKAPAPTQPTVQVPAVRKSYDCKASRCARRGTDGFASRDALETHMRSAHDRDAVRRRQG